MTGLGGPPRPPGYFAFARANNSAASIPPPLVQQMIGSGRYPVAYNAPTV
jgi:hypothetical protein